jgi:hypothetical protein
MTDRIALSKYIFKYNQQYTEKEILHNATPVNYQDEFLIADTPFREYWFIREGHYWKLSHTWGHFTLGIK